MMRDYEARRRARVWDHRWTWEFAAAYLAEYLAESGWDPEEAARRLRERMEQLRRDPDWRRSARACWIAAALIERELPVRAVARLEVAHE